MTKSDNKEAQIELSMTTNENNNDLESSLITNTSNQEINPSQDPKPNEDSEIPLSTRLQSFYIKRDTEAMKKREKTLKELSLFPIFGDKELAKFSVNYFLYLEFFHMGIRMFFALLIFSGLSYLAYLIVAEYNMTYASTQLSVIAYGAFIIAAGLVLRIVRLVEEKRVIDNNIFQELQWTEDLFSVRVRNLPKDTSLPDLKQYFEDLLFYKNVKGCVKEIILLQDFYKYTKVKKALAKADEKLKNSDKMRLDTKTKLTVKKEALESRLVLLESELLRSECFKGKAIVIFGTIEAKYTIYNFFKTSWITAPFRHCCPCFSRKHYFKGNLLEVQEAIEPHDVIFENIHFPRVKRGIRKTIAYAISIAVIFYGLYELSGLQSDYIYSGISNGQQSLGDQIIAYSFVLRIIIINIILERSYYYANRLLIYPSSSEANISCLDYSIYTSFMLYVTTQSIAAMASRDLWIRQLLQMAIAYLVKISLIKCLPTILNSVYLGKSAIINASKLVSNLVGKLRELYEEFDFMDGISGATPIIFIGFAYMTVNPFLFLPIIMITLYIFAIVDKYQMIKYCKPMEWKSANYVLKAFRVYKWESFCVYSGGLIAIGAYYYEVVENDQYDYDFFLCLCYIILAIIIAYIWWPIPLNTEAREKFYKKNSQAQYDSVKDTFSSFYKDENPLTKIMKEIKNSSL